MKLGLFQRQVAVEIGVDGTTIFNWEGNCVEPAVRLIPRIIEFLGYCPYAPGLPLSGRLKLWRQGLGFSQEKMAEAIRIDEGTWRRWEAGKRQPGSDYQQRINAFLEAHRGS